MALYDRLRDSVKMVDGEIIEPRTTRGGISGLFGRMGDKIRQQEASTAVPVTTTAPVFTTAPQGIDLGGGLGTIPMPQFSGLDQERLNNYLQNLNPSIFGIRPDTFDEYLRDQEEREAAQEEEQVDTGLEDTGVSEEVISDVVDLDEAPVMPTVPSVGAIDSVTGEVIPEEDVILTTMPVGGRGGFVPPPPPATDVVTGEEIPLITPITAVPQDSMTGLASYFTAPQIQQIVSPPQQVPGTSDMEKLLQLQNESFRKFLVQPQTQQPVASLVVTTAPATGGETGYMGTGYVPGETYQPISFGTPYDPMMQLNNYTYTQPQGIQFTPSNQMIGMPQPLSIQDTRSTYGDVYGGLVFPDFSGITSLVPFDARQQII